VDDELVHTDQDQNEDREEGDTSHEVQEIRSNLYHHAFVLLTDTITLPSPLSASSAVGQTSVLVLA
jgi:hypothetical protein